MRVLTFANGHVLRERLVGIDEHARRLAYTVEDARLTHHNASLQVLPAAGGEARIVWTTDVLPNEAGGPIGAMMLVGVQAMRTALGALMPRAHAELA